MIRFLEQLIATFFNRLRGRRGEARFEGGSLDLGARVVDGQVTRWHVGLSNTRRATHLAVLGKTGTGKSFFLRYLMLQDIEAGRGFLCFDLHGDITPFLLQAINARERRLRRHLSDKLIVIDPTDPIYSVGFNPLEQETTDFVCISEFAAVLKVRWGLDHFGARTDELLRNSLYVLSANKLTLLELAPLLTHAGFRAACLKNVPNAEVRQYFETRFDQTSEAMRATMREPILNKTSAEMRSAILAVGTHVFFQLSSVDSTQVRKALDGGTSLAERLKNLPQRRCIVKSERTKHSSPTSLYRSVDEVLHEVSAYEPRWVLLPALDCVPRARASGVAPHPGRLCGMANAFRCSGRIPRS